MGDSSSSEFLSSVEGDFWRDTQGADAERHTASEHNFTLALRAPAAAGDKTTGAYAMSFMAVQHYSVGNPQDAVNLPGTAETNIGRAATPRMRAMLSARRARALSKTGNQKACAKALNQARDLMAAGPSDDDPPYLYKTLST